MKATEFKSKIEKLFNLQSTMDATDAKASELQRELESYLSSLPATISPDHLASISAKEVVLNNAVNKAQTSGNDYSQLRDEVFGFLKKMPTVTEIHIPGDLVGRPGQLYKFDKVTRMVQRTSVEWGYQ